MYEPDSSSSSIVSSTKKAQTTDGSTCSISPNPNSPSTSSTTMIDDAAAALMTMDGHEHGHGTHWLIKSGPGSSGSNGYMEKPSSKNGNGNNASTKSVIPGNENEPHSLPEQSSNLSSSTPSSSSGKAKPQKLCQVCGDKAKSFHFGGLSCDSCKAFFRRSVHNEAHKAFQCVYKNVCEINIGSRKACQFCRFEKCMRIGMEKNWVMTEVERSQLQKQRNEKKEPPKEAGAEMTPTIFQPDNSTTTDADSANFEPNIADMLKFMTAAERDEIESIVNKYQHSYREIPFRVSKFEGARNSVEIIQMFTTILRRFAYFTKLIPEFSALSVNDQSTLLRAGVLEMCLLRSALAFDLENNRWPKTEHMEFLKDCPQLRVEDMEKLVSKDLYHMHMQFINGIQELKVDEPTVMILLLIVLFYPERGPLEQQELISQTQEKYLLLLNKYVQWRYGPRSGKIFPKLLTRLADLRQLNDFHTEYNLKMTRTEVEEIQEQLGNINLNPYPQWVLVEDQQNSTTNSPAASSRHSAHSYAADDQYGQMHGPGPIPMQVGHGHGDLNFQTSDANPQTQIPAHAHHHQPHPEPPSMRQLFMQFVSQKIPTLIANPFAQFPMEAEMSSAAAFFEQMGSGSGANSLQQFQASMLSSSAGSSGGGIPMQQETRPESYHDNANHHQEPEKAGAEPGQLSQIANILESSDPNALRQLKESLSPSVIAKLSSIFGGGAGGGVGGAAAAELLNSGAFDLSKISPELISSFMSGGLGNFGSTDMAYQQHYENYPGSNFAQNQNPLPDRYNEVDMAGNWSHGHSQPNLVGPGNGIQSQIQEPYSEIPPYLHHSQVQAHFEHTPNPNAEQQHPGYANANNHW